MAIKVISLAFEAGSMIENCPLTRRLDYALTRVITDVLPSTVRYIEQYLPSIIVPGHDEDWPIFLRYPFYGMIVVPVIVGLMFVVMFGLRVLSDAVERRNEAEARRMEAEAERCKVSIAGC
ncbi:hypothetical protein F503_05638 [Ophiostoma piceae UAMH 11346]|uniref:Uncharacterized protein n=1 Tax=Ophiostoma piceae (strain UAMH 11346) TaxID=1262450 RepID=S3CUZ2_OPHP1|nr:hypothetical protein F503_05638 [Ophiostoma piceae UAMH 11346]